MDLDDPRTMALFLEIYGSLPRAGPGRSTDTSRALRMLPIGEPGAVLDLGCGPGAQTLVLAESLPAATIVAVDLLPQMAVETRRRYLARGLGRRVHVLVGDMLSPGVPNGSQDLIWCEAAIYSVGVESALRAWRPLLAPAGAVGFTEPVWRHDDPPDELVGWWRSEYPSITDEAGVRAAIAAAGFVTVGTFMLPPAAWWDGYYEPMEAVLEDFRSRHGGDPLADEIANAAELEIKIFRRYNQHYSYAFFVVRPD